MTSRYADREVFTAKPDGVHEKLVDTRTGARKIDYFETAHFQRLTQEQIDSMEIITHVWTIGDRYFKLAETYYGSTEFWWVIARFNDAPTEAHLSIGDQVLIPNPLQDILYIFKQQEVM